MKPLKPNRCQVLFRCPAETDCVYFKFVGDTDECEYYNKGMCMSAVARVNAVTLVRRVMLEDER
jgi:hypothetical protein